MNQTRYAVFVQKKDATSGIPYLQLANAATKHTLNNWNKQADTIFTVGSIDHAPLNYNYWELLPEGSKSFELTYPKEIILGDSLEVSLLNSGNALLSAKIESGLLANSEDSLLSGQRLQLQDKPKVTGNYRVNYSVSDTLSYHANIRINEPEEFMVYLFAATPDFEWKFLNDYFSKRGHAVFWNTIVSKARYKEQLSNWPDSINFGQNKIAYERYKLIIMDLDAWNGLNALVQNSMLEKIAEGKGTLLFRAGNNTSLNDKAGKISPTISTGNIIESDDLSYSYLQSISEWKKVGKYQYIYNNNKMNLGLLTLQNSYIWMLNGDEAFYNAFWTDYLNKLMSENKEEFYFHSDWAVINEPFIISKWSTGTNDSLLIVNPKGDTKKWSTEKDEMMTERSQLIFYPDTTGWHSFSFNNEQPIPFYVHPENMAGAPFISDAYHYQYQRSMDELKSNADKNSSNNNAKTITIWFFSLFLLSISYLWIEEKLA